MHRLSYTQTQGDINNVLAYQDGLLGEISMPDLSPADESIARSERILTDLGYTLPERSPSASFKADLTPPSWEELSAMALSEVGSDNSLEDLFSEDELRSNEAEIRELNEQYNQLHRLDRCDIAIAALAGVLAGAADILLVGIPEKTHEGLKAGPLSDYIRDAFDREFPPDEMERLANSKASKVPFDAQDNRNTQFHVERLSAYYHRLLSLGHDPLLGFVVGVSDILTGRMTTIDKSGAVVSQVMDVYDDRIEKGIFAAVAKQVAHLMSDMTTSMGLPAPLMGLFNLMQFGSIGEYEQTVAEIVQGMYYEGYDFIHFCSMSVSAAVAEAVVRIGYAIKRVREGYSISESIPFSTDREAHPKLATMLFIAHSAATAINAGKVYFTENPLAINYPQWLAFAKYSYQQLHWAILTKPNLRESYALGEIASELDDVYHQVNEVFADIQNGAIVI